MLEIRNQSDLTEKHIKRKAAGYQRLSSNWLWLFMAVYKPSFADAKMLKNILKHHIICHFPCNIRNKRKCTLVYPAKENLRIYVNQAHPAPGG